MRAADFSWRAPPSPVKTSISSSAIVALQLRHKRGSVPPKEPTFAFNLVRGCLPQSLHSPQLSEPDPIYPYLPFLFCFTLSQRACHPNHALLAIGRNCRFTRNSVAIQQTRICTQPRRKDRELYLFSTAGTVQSHDNRSLMSRKCLNKCGDLFRCVVDVRSDP